jgi:phospholipid/cholesterol/gamma-HCH transport system ATP-binding protein
MEAEANQVVIRAHDLVVGFGGQTVLDHLSLDVRRGEILGLAGASGSGKSVLLRTVIGLVPKRSGSVQFFAMGPDGLTDTRAMARHWGVLFQQGALFSSLTVRQNIQFPLREILKLSDRLLDELAAAKLEMVGLSDRDGDKYPSEISGGMTKRAALARALALDPISAGDFDSLIRTLQRTLGLTVFMVTHDLDSLHTVCDRIAALADGKVVADGPIPTMLASEHPWVKAYFRGRRSRATAPN